jgi:hypothetical protein
VDALKFALLRSLKGRQVNIPELGCGYSVATHLNFGYADSNPVQRFLCCLTVD